MSNDDSRGNESPDRRDELTPSNDLRTHLEALDDLTHALLEALRDPRTEIDGRTLTESKRREARLRCRKIRAETSQLGLLLFGTEALIPYHPEGSFDATDTGTGVTVYSGPDSELLESDGDALPDDEDDRPDADDLRDENDRDEGTDD